METTMLTIQVPKNIGAILEEKAKTIGKTVEEYIVYLIERHIYKRKILDETPIEFR